MTKQEKFNFFDWVAEGINSLGAVLLPMLFFISGGVFCSHTYFKQIFPDTMSYWEQYIAAWLIAVGWESTVLVTTANRDLIQARWIPRFMALCTGIIFLFFIEAFSADLTTFVRVTKFFVGILVSFTSYVYVELFARKWDQRNAHRDMPEKLAKAESELNLTQRSIKETENERTTLRNQVSEMFVKLTELEAYKASVILEKTCPHCKVTFDSFTSAHSHKGHCDHNPNKRGVKLNGHHADN